jgi:Ca-activated chloride channel family protein
MNLLSPWSLAWLGLLVPLVALYVLKRRRQRKVVGSTLLWEAAMRDLRSERPWQRLRPHLSLLLQALALIAGAIALARPAGAGQVPIGARVAVVIDTSASMGAREENGDTRLEAAREMAIGLARDLPPGGEMLIVEAASEANVHTAATHDRAVLERALGELAVRGARADLEAAVAVAAERLHEAPSGSRIVVLTDAAFSGTIPLEASAPVEVRRVGSPLVNHAITALDVRAAPATDAPDRAEIFVRVARFGEGAADLRVTASIAGGALLASRRVRVEDGTPEAVVMTADLPPSASGDPAVVRAEIEVIDGTDPLALDDVAVAASPGARRLPVFLVGDAPSSVRRVLLADGEIELFATDLAALAQRRESDPDAAELDGLFIYAGAVPDAAPPGDSIVVEPSGERVFGVELGAASDPPTIVSWEESDPRMRFVRFSDVHLGPVRPIARAARPLLTTSAGSAIAVLERADGETTIVSFDPDVGDWAAQPGFVVFFRNLLERARARRAAGGVAPGAVGEPLRIPAPDGSRVRVTTPSGRVLTAPARGGIAIVFAAAEPGVFRVRAGERERFALRNLLDPEESTLAPRARFVRHDGRTAHVTSEPIEHREAWPWIALALLIFLALEALWATRKGATA